jgi:putative heme iron utilization protein
MSLTGLNLNRRSHSSNRRSTPCATSVQLRVSDGYFGGPLTAPSPHESTTCEPLITRATHRPVPNDHRRPTPLEEPTLPAARAPTHAERCRTLAAGAKSAALCTVARDPSGFPYGSLVTVAIDDVGRPLLLLSELAEHTGNLHAQPEASVLLTEPLGAHDQPLALGRVTILGPCARVAREESDAVRGAFLAQQPSASYYVDFKDFAFYRVEPLALRYVGGFGRMSWVTAEDYRAAQPDPLAASAAGILKHMNDDHADAVLGYATSLAGIPDATSATMTAVDRYGFELATVTPKGPRATRLAFDVEVVTSDEVRRAMVALVKRARDPKA